MIVRRMAKVRESGGRKRRGRRWRKNSGHPLVAIPGSIFTERIGEDTF
jgi:hypothetical protein